MKKIIRTILITFSLILTFSVSSYAAQTGTILDKTDKSDEDPKQDPEPDGARKPAARIYCTIDSSTGVAISNHSNEAILSYGIFDADTDECIGVFLLESEFIDTLFSLEGEFRVVFTCEDYVLSGIVEVYE